MGLSKYQAEKLEEFYQDNYATKHPDIIFDKHTNKVILNPSSVNERIYNSSPILNDFHNDKSLVRCIMGPYGSGKTVGATCIDLLIKAIQIPKCKDGVRYSRFFVIRNTYSELETTTVKSWSEWLGDLGSAHLSAKSPFTYRTDFFDEHGKISMEVIFLSLDREKDIKKLKSLEATGIVIEEACEVPKAVMTHSMGRIGRYPSKINLTDPFYRFVTLVTNAPSDEHWIYSTFEQKLPKKFAIFHQPPGLIKNNEIEKWEDNIHAENRHNLPENYYRDMALGQTDQFIRVYCNGEYGIVSDKEPVYSAYNDDLHSSDSLDYDSELKINLGWDFGLTPSVVISQICANGWINIIGEIMGAGIGVEGFMLNQVIPYLNTNFPDHTIGFSVGDPAGGARDDIKNRSKLSMTKAGKPILGIMEEIGIKTTPCSTNSPLLRLDAVNKGLTTLIDARPKLMISRKCKLLRKGFIGGYYIVNGNKADSGTYKPTPYKGYYSHIHDALQYNCVQTLDNHKKQSDNVIIDYSQPIA